MKRSNRILYMLFGGLLVACHNGDHAFDATGSFEAIERTISAEATGKILSLNMEEGNILEAGDTIGLIDVTHLRLQAAQVEASIQAIEEKTNDPGPQIEILKARLSTQDNQVATLEQQMAVLEKEIRRFQNLVGANAAPQKQLDDLTGQKSILHQQLQTAQAQREVIKTEIAAARKNVQIQNRAVLSETTPGQKRLEMLREQIEDAWIINAYPGTVTTKMAYDGEFTTVGKPLYRIADLSEIILRAYITSDQLATVKLNDTVQVRTDDGSGDMKETTGIVTWISSEAEFTPKTIQTKHERANMVYAMKVRVKNDGTYKMGMYGEIKFLDNE